MSKVDRDDLGRSKTSVEAAIESWAESLEEEGDITKTMQECGLALKD